MRARSGAELDGRAGEDLAGARVAQPDDDACARGRSAAGQTRRARDERRPASGARRGRVASGGERRSARAERRARARRRGGRRGASRAAAGARRRRVAPLGAAAGGGVGAVARRAGQATATGRRGGRAAGDGEGEAAGRRATRTGSARRTGCGRRRRAGRRLDGRLGSGRSGGCWPAGLGIGVTEPVGTRRAGSGVAATGVGSVWATASGRGSRERARSEVRSSDTSTASRSQPGGRCGPRRRAVSR